jgi:hypothetical protein
MMKKTMTSAVLCAAALACQPLLAAETPAQRDNRMADTMRNERLKAEAAESRSYIPVAKPPVPAASKAEKPKDAKEAKDAKKKKGEKKTEHFTVTLPAPKKVKAPKKEAGGKS